MAQGICWLIRSWQKIVADLAPCWGFFCWLCFASKSGLCVIMQVVFALRDGWYVARVGDTRVRVLYDETSWCLHWTTYCSVNECAGNWWCEKLNCDLDDLDEGNIDDDEYCIECPREIVEAIDEDSYTDDSWSGQPANLEEARKLILKRYENVPHNRLTADELNPANKNLRDIMYGTWSLRA